MTFQISKILSKKVKNIIICVFKFIKIAILNKNANGNEEKFLQHTFVTQKHKDLENGDEAEEEDDDVQKEHLENKEI